MKNKALTCPHCNSSNAPDANFCLNCGMRISVTCPHCSRRMVSQAQFCDRCGSSLQGQAAQPAQNIPAAAQTPIEIPAAPPQPQPQTEISEAQKQPEPTTKETAPQPAASASPLDQYIPKELMRKLQSARASGDMIGERRVVTMLFCDVKGSTSAAEQLDPEEWSDIINGAFTHMIQPVFRYEGMVARLMGDGILAFFGAPLAHEDDPQRAILAGLDILTEITPYREKIQKEWNIEMNVRVGINTGLVVVGAVGSDLRMEYTALGDAINLAARMEQTAEPGSVQIAEDTYKLVKPLFEFEPIGPIEIKGKDEPVNAYRVMGRKANQGRMRGIEGLHAEMVGRDREMEVLEDVLTDLKQGVGRIIMILGEAGFGKSRLILETQEKYHEIMESDEGWYETSSLSYETNQAYVLVQRLIRRVCDIRFDDAPKIIEKKLESVLEDLPEENQKRAKSLLLLLFGISEPGDNTIDGDDFHKELHEILDTWLRKKFSNQPTVMVIDDMHWSDKASIKVFNQLLGLADRIPLVMICAMRLDREAPAWQVKTNAELDFRHRYTEISLRPLAEADSNELVNRLLEIPDIHDELRRSILDKSDGNPFFIEEVVRALIENQIVRSEDREEGSVVKHYWVSQSDGSDFSIPNNLQSLLSARMDQLEESTRSTLQLASVIGRNFYLRVLEEVNESSAELDKQVSTLLRMDMIRESARVPEIEYAFRNPLTQEAVYKTILLKNRREFHHRVAAAMENLFQENLEGKYALLSHHYSLAGDQQNAVKYIRKASQQSIKVYAYEEAEKNLMTALNLLAGEEQSELRVLIEEELADICRLLRKFNDALSMYQDALENWHQLEEKDDAVALRINRKIVEIATEAKWSVDAKTYAMICERGQKSLVNLKKNLKKIDKDSPTVELVNAYVALSTDAWRVQSPVDWDSCQQYAQQAVDSAQKIGDSNLLSLALGALATALDGQSLLREHLAIAERRLEITLRDDHNIEREKIDALRGMGAALMYVGEYEQALPYLEQTEAEATNVRAPDQMANALGLMAQSLFRMDRWDEVLEVEKRWRDLDLRYTRERVGET